MSHVKKNQHVKHGMSRVLKFEKPFITMFSDGDPITRGGERIFQSRIPGAKDQPHTIIKGGGHFLQEDCGTEFAGLIVDFIYRTS
jgi:haloalkane dehalogenase